jgi:hypothetical protein
MRNSIKIKDDTFRQNYILRRQKEKFPMRGEE